MREKCHSILQFSWAKHFCRKQIHIMQFTKTQAEMMTSALALLRTRTRINVYLRKKRVWSGHKHQGFPVQNMGHSHKCRTLNNTLANNLLEGGQLLEK